MEINFSQLEKLEEWPLAEKIIGQLNAKGFTAYLAGGCVRDLLLSKTPKDLDVATSAHPGQVKELFSKTVDIGEEFGTIIVVDGKQSIEVTSFRFDGKYVDGRHPEGVVFSNEVEDAKRRDFTVNALFYDPRKKKLIDHIEGVKDLEAMTLRTVGQPAERFSEDKLRILRALRFSVEHNFSIESETFKAVQDFAVDIREVSSERIVQELSRVFQSENRNKGFDLLEQSGVLKEVLPSLCNNYQLFVGYLKHYSLFGYEETLYLLAYFILSQSKDIEEELKVFGLSKAFKKQLLQAYADSAFLIESKGLYEKVLILDKKNSPVILELAKASLSVNGEGLQLIESVLDEYNRRLVDGQLPRVLLDGNDLIELGVPKGSLVGEISRRIYKSQILEGLNSKEKAKQQVAAWLKEIN